MLAVASHARIGVLVGDREGDVLRLVYASAVAAELLGTTREAMVGRDAKDFIETAVHSEALRISSAAREGQRVQMPFELTARRTDNTAFAIDLALTTVALEGRTLSVILFWSVESRRAAQDQARAIDALYRSVIEGAPDGVVVSRDRVVVWANPSAARMLGFAAPEALLGRKVNEMLLPADAAEMNVRVQGMLERAERYPVRSYRAVRPDGQTVVAEITSIPFQWDGAPAILAFARDVTARASEQARMAQTDRLAALGTLAAGVAHKINNPMAAVIFGIEGVERMLRRPALDEKTREDVLRLLQDLRRGADRVTRIVKDLRTFSRGGDETIEATDLRPVVESAERLAGHAVRERAQLHLELGEPPRVRGNAVRLEQVLVNLLINAAQAMPEGRAPAANHVYVRTRVEGAHVVLEVVDNGVGIPPEVLPRIFEPFFTTKPVGVGTGLGLPICHGIVQQLGGELSAESSPGHGATLRVRLLRADA